MLNLEQVQRIYLDELGEAAENSLGVGVVKLVVESEENAVEIAKSLMSQAREQLIDEAIQRNLIDLHECLLSSSDGYTASGKVHKWNGSLKFV